MEGIIRPGGIKTNKKIGIVFIFAILAVVVFASGCTQQNNNTTIQNNTTQQNTTNVTKPNVVAVLKGPETAKKGMNVTVQYQVTNNGNGAATNVQIRSQQLQQTIGTLNSGETKTISAKIPIPTDAEVQEDFGPESSVPNPFFIGGFVVTYGDASGNKYNVTSNSIEIKLV